MADPTWWPRLLAWLFCLACLTPAVWRIVRYAARRRPCLYLDPVWAVVFLLALNRLAYVTQVSAPVANATAFLLAITMGLTAAWYQAHDR